MKMRNKLFLLLSLFMFLSLNCNEPQEIETQIPLPIIKVEYPETYEDTSQVEQYGDHLIKDPFQWLEQFSPSTSFWVKNQTSLTRNYIEQIPFRTAIEERLTGLWDHERLHLIGHKRGYYYWLYNSGLDEQDKLYRSMTLDGTKELVLDPMNIAQDGSVSLSNFKFSNEGDKLAFELSSLGSDLKEIQVIDLESLKVLEEKIIGVKFSNIAWFENGFFYSQFPLYEQNNKLTYDRFHQLYYHKIGTSQSKDELVFADRSNANRIVQAQVSIDNRYLIVEVEEVSKGNAIYVKDLEDGDNSLIPVIEGFDHQFDYVGNMGDDFFFTTDYQAPKKRLVKISILSPAENSWETVLMETSNVLHAAVQAGNQIIVSYLKDAVSKLALLELKDNSHHELVLPPDGTVKSIVFSDNLDQAYLNFSSFTMPDALYGLDLRDLQLTMLQKTDVKWDASQMEVKQLWFKSNDGTDVPMFVIHKKGLELDGSHPTLLYGYGGFNVSLTPVFNISNLNLFPFILEHNGVCAVANIRGGGELGERWHRLGKLESKQNGFDDFQSAAEFLISEKYTSSDHLAIYGRSNGGLLVGACLVQRPDLFKVAFPAVGVLDMLRYQHFSIGWTWAGEYGLSTDPKAFDYLRAYSPVHNVDTIDYPATLVLTSSVDNRVVPSHSYKFAATLQSKQRADYPVLIRIDEHSGHGLGKTTSQKIQEAADILSFMYYNIGVDLSK